MKRGSLDEHVEIALFAYPTIYRSRRDVIEHLYCVIGNGYEWAHGKLSTRGRPEAAWKQATVRVRSGERMTPELRKKLVREHYESFCDDPASSFNWGPMEDATPEFRATLRATLIERVVAKCDQPKERDPRFSVIYPLCSYSRMRNVPDDVRQDWLDGAYEAVEMVLATPGEMDAANREFAAQVKADLDKRFPGRKAP